MKALEINRRLWFLLMACSGAENESAARKRPLWDLWASQFRLVNKMDPLETFIFIRCGFFLSSLMNGRHLISAQKEGTCILISKGSRFSFSSASNNKENACLAFCTLCCCWRVFYCFAGNRSNLFPPQLENAGQENLKVGCFFLFWYVSLKFCWLSKISGVKIFPRDFYWPLMRSKKKTNFKLVTLQK